MMPLQEIEGFTWPGIEFGVPPSPKHSFYEVSLNGNMHAKELSFPPLHLPNCNGRPRTLLMRLAPAQYIDALRLGDLERFNEIEAESGDWWFPTLDRGAGAALHFAADHGQVRRSTAHDGLIGGCDRRDVLPYGLTDWNKEVSIGDASTGMIQQCRRHLCVPPHNQKRQNFKPADLFAQLDAARMLLERRQARVNQADARWGWTPLHRAARVAHYGHAPGLDLFELLLRHGADASLKTLEGAAHPTTVRAPDSDQTTR